MRVPADWFGIDPLSSNAWLVNFSWTYLIFLIIFSIMIALFEFATRRR